MAGLPIESGHLHVLRPDHLGVVVGVVQAGQPGDLGHQPVGEIAQVSAVVRRRRIGPQRRSEVDGYRFSPARKPLARRLDLVGADEPDGHDGRARDKRQSGRPQAAAVKPPVA